MDTYKMYSTRKNVMSSSLYNISKRGGYCGGHFPARKVYLFNNIGELLREFSSSEECACYFNIASVTVGYRIRKLCLFKATYEGVVYNNCSLSYSPYLLF